MRWCLLLLCLMPLQAEATSIYLCKAYSGGMFWSSVTCGQKSATIDRIVTVPDGTPWEQQVRLGEQARSNAAALTAPPPAPVVQQQQFQQADKQSECNALEARIANIEARQRQPQSGQTQDWLNERKRKARDRQFQIKC